METWNIGTRVRDVKLNKIFIYDIEYLGLVTDGCPTENIFEVYGMNEFLTTKFEILPEDYDKKDKEIDIDKLEEFEVAGCNVKMGDTWISTESLVGDMLVDKTNKIIKALKQLNDKLKE